MFKRFVCLLMTLFAMLVHAHAERRALVIGNDNYHNVPLANARNDASAVATDLKSLGYVTTLVLDADRAKMEGAIDRFVGSITPGDVALLYYAGHGMQVDGENYLIPTDFSAVSPSQGKYQGYSLSNLLDNVEAHGATTRIVILDACRDNPFRGARSLHGGWAGVNSSAGSFIAFGTSPGSTAADSPGRGHGTFTEALLKHLTTSQLDIDQTFELVREDVILASGGHQIPWTATSLVGSFHLVPGLDSTKPNAGAAIQKAASLASSKTTSSTPGQRSRTIGSDTESNQDTAGVARLKALYAEPSLNNVSAGTFPTGVRPGPAGTPTTPHLIPEGPRAEDLPKQYGGLTRSETLSSAISTDGVLPSKTLSVDLSNDESKLTALLLDSAISQLQDQHFEDAQRSLEALLDLDPRTELVARLLSLTLGRLGRTHESIRILDRSITSHPHSALLLHDRCIEEAEINPTQAVEDCKEAISLMPEIADGHNSLAAAYLSADSVEMAARELQRSTATKESASLRALLEAQLTTKERPAR